MDYLTLKWLYILSSTFLFGTGVGSAFQNLFQNREHKRDKASSGEETEGCPEIEPANTR